MSAARAEPFPVPRGRPAARIAGAAAVLLGGFVASRLVGLLRNVVVSAQFGTSADYDLYVAAFLIPDTIFSLIAGGALSSALVPVFAEYLAARRPGAVVELAGSVFNIVALAAGLAAAAGMVFAPHLVAALFAGFDAPGQQARLAALLRMMLLQPVLLAMSEVLSRYLNVREHFAFPALAPTIYNLAIIVAALGLGPWLGTLGLAAGVTLGAAAYLAVQIPAARTHGFRWRPALDLREPGLRRIALLMLPRMVGQGAVQLSLIYTTRLASFLPTGSVAALSYALQLMMLPLGAFAMSAAGAALPILATQAAQRDLDAFAATARRTLGAILFAIVPSAVGLGVAGLPIVQTLFQRGNFDLESSLATARALALYAAGLPAHGAIEILARSFYALHDTRRPVAIGLVAMVANALLASALVGPLGFLGIALAFSAAAWAEALALAVTLWRRLPGFFAGDLAASLRRTAAAGAALAVATMAAVAATRAAGLPPVAQTLASLAAGGGAYGGVAFARRSPELLAAVGMLRRRLAR